MEEQLSKRSFFAALESLDHLDDTEDEEEEDFLKRVAARKPSEIPIPTAATISVSPGPPAPGILTRANTDPKQPPTDQFETAENTGVKTPRRTEQSRRVEQSTDPKVRSVQRHNTTGSMPDPKSRGPVSKKRKPNKNIKVVPEDQQIFKDLVFCG